MEAESQVTKVGLPPALLLWIAALYGSRITGKEGGLAPALLLWIAALYGSRITGREGGLAPALSASMPNQRSGGKPTFLTCYSAS
jgi:hypothetical protein